MRQSYIRTLSLIILHLVYNGVNGLRTCTTVNSPQDLKEAIHNQETSFILICPFEMNDFRTIQIKRSNISIVCAKEKSTDVCSINSEKRHFNIFADSVTFVGFHFSNSQRGSVRAKGERTSFIDCLFES
jgi:hypothetical protein